MKPVKDGDDLAPYASSATSGGEILWTLAIAAGALLFVSGLGTVAYRGLLWLRFGETPAWLVGDYLYFQTSWVGVNRIIAWIGGWPLEAGLLAGGLAITVIGIINADAAWRRRQS